MTTSEGVQPEDGKRNAKREAKDKEPDLSFKGIITPDEISHLHRLFDDLVICPGLIGPFGTRVDSKGRIRIPGALTGFREARLRFQGWENNAKEGNEKLQWWLERLEERGGTPLKGIDLLNGITIETWKAYQKTYSDCANAQAQQRWRLKRRREAIERQLEEERLEEEAEANGALPAPKASKAPKGLRGRQKKRGKAKK